ncbi:FliH/SctL family protein [Bacillus cereus]|uniref:FliH/SctL family protein n=1 Tax=Bacillus cereus TaxID=1396 RepID=UPI000B4AE615|nr:FliH/SctL family protein [Bacillus cereus]
MSFSNKKIIKSVKQNDEAIHIDEHISSSQQAYIEKTSKKKLDAYTEELEEYRMREIAKANADAEAIRTNAYTDGYSRAKEEALAEVREEVEITVRKEWKEEFEKVKEQYLKANNYMISQEEKLENKKSEWISKNEEDIVEILMASVKKIIAREIHLEKDEVKNLVRETMKEVNDKSKTIWIRVNPEVKDKISKQEWNDRQIEWIADPSLSQLEVMIETETEWIDSTLKNKIENLKKIIEEWVKQNDLLS